MLFDLLDFLSAVDYSRLLLGTAAGRAVLFAVISLAVLAAAGLVSWIVVACVAFVSFFVLLALEDRDDSQRRASEDPD